MEIAQDTFYIPDDIATGLATGLYRRRGSVVRYAVGPNKGRIVNHLESIDLKAVEQAQGFGVKALQFVQQHKKEVGIAATGAAAIGAVFFIYSKWKNYESKVQREFRVAFKMYIESIRQGNVDIDVIDSLVNALEAIKKHKNYGKINIQLTTEELCVLVNRIYGYTIKLAEDNDVKMSEYTIQTDNDILINLEEYLKIQKEIFEQVA